MCDLGTIYRTRHFFGCRLVARLIGIAVLQLADIFRGRIYEYFAGFAVPHDVYTQQSQDETQEEQWQGNIFGDTKHAITYRKIISSIRLFAYFFVPFFLLFFFLGVEVEAVGAGAAVSPNSANNWASADRKSTRLNSSHITISYAVFCLKKKNSHDTTVLTQTNIIKKPLQQPSS